MPTPHVILEQMDTILNQLIHTAEKLREMSSQVIEKEEFNKLQQTQANLIQQLTTLDETYHKLSKKGMGDDSLKQKIDKKVEMFAKLNAQFIDTIHESQSFLNINAKHKSLP